MKDHKEEPLYKIFGCGYDFGNSNTCLVLIVDGEMVSQIIPSALVEGSYEELARKVVAGPSTNMQGIFSERKHVISLTYNGKDESFFVGDLAIDQAPNMSSESLTGRGSVSRYWSVRSLSMLLSISGTIIKDKEYGLSVVTNLPIETHDEHNVRQVKEALTGIHDFCLDGIERRAHVTVKKTIMEGSGANIAHASGRQDKTAIVDIGGRTTDGYLVAGHTPVIGKCKSYDCGVETAFDIFRDEFEANFRWSLSTSDIARIQKCYVTNKQYSEIPSVQNSEADVKKVDLLVEKAVRSTGRNISDFISRIWSSSLKTDIVASDTNLVLLIGGGAYYFERDLRPIFGKRLTVPVNPEYANALGYAKLAQHYLQKEKSKVGM
jgi:hypothetical protein